MAEPADVPQKTFTGYLSLEKNIRINEKKEIRR